MTTHYGQEALSVLTNNAPDFETLDEGDQAKYNHADCPNGMDNRERLYVKNVDGAFMWHCHNCGDSGYYRPKETVRRMKATTRAVVSRTPIPDYSRLTKETDYDKFKVEGQLWLGQYGFTEAMVRQHRIAETDEGIVLPIFSNVFIQGYQVRRYNKAPKYLTYSKQRFSFLDCISGMTAKPLVIVEDLLSSYKLRTAGYPTLCLLGTKLDGEAQKVLSMFRSRRAVLWLDDDVAGHSATTKLFVDISPIVPNISAIFNHQPKEISLEILKDMEL
jgi:hypothetical protein